jgi:hypothetical protein
MITIPRTKAIQAETTVILFRTTSLLCRGNWKKKQKILIKMIAGCLFDKIHTKKEKTNPIDFMPFKLKKTL